MENTITTTATGQAGTLPDKARVQLELTSEADSATEARNNAEDRESSIRDTLLTENQLGAVVGGSATHCDYASEPHVRSVRTGRDPMARRYRLV